MAKKAKPMSQSPLSEPILQMEWHVIPYTHVFKRHPLSGDFRIMTEDEFDRLVEDIKANGLRSPIVLAHDDTEAVEGDKGKVFDGWNRYLACVKAEVDLKVRDYSAEIDGPLEAFAVSLNVHRRHLTSEEKRLRLEARLKADPGLSDRQIGAAVGMDHKTVAAMRQHFVDRGEIPHTGERTDTTGRKQAATKSPAKGRTQRSKPARPLKAAKENMIQITDEASQKELFDQIFTSWGIKLITRWLGFQGYLVSKRVVEEDATDGATAN